MAALLMPLVKEQASSAVRQQYNTASITELANGG